MNETLSYFSSQPIDFKITKKQILTVTTSTQAASLANNIFGDYIIQNTLASAGSAFYYKSNVGFSFYAPNTVYLQLSLPKLPKRVFVSINLDAYNHCNFGIYLKNLDNTPITFPIYVMVNSRNNQWAGGNNSAITLNGHHYERYCGYTKHTDLINKTGNFDAEWNINVDCYDEFTPCILEFQHNSTYNSKCFYLTGLEINL